MSGSQMRCARKWGQMPLAAALTVVCLGLTACGSDSLLGGLTGERSGTVQSASLPIVGQSGGILGGGGATGTFVGARVEALRGDLQKLQGAVNERQAALQGARAMTSEAAARYHATVAGINAKLQVGTTPGNPILVNQWNEAQSALDKVAESHGRMSQVATLASADSTFAAYLLESTRAAYGLQGAVDQDHRALAGLEDEVNRTVVVVDRLLNEISDDLARQQSYLGAERSNLATLAVGIKNGELFGQNLQNRAFASTISGAQTSPALRGAQGGANVPFAARGANQRPQAARTSAATNSAPLVVIRFDKPNPQYEQSLYNAVSRALERKPDASFELVAVAPNRGAGGTPLGTVQAKRHAENVLRSMTDMGLAPRRVAVSSAQSSVTDTNEVHLFVR